MKTKYIKVSVSEILPQESTELYFYCNYGYCNAGDYNKERNRFIGVNGTKYGIEHVDHWLEEVPDMEEEMREMLEECLEYMPYSEKPKVNKLLNKLNQQS